MCLDPLFKAGSLAVVGASPGAYFSDRLFENIALGGRGRVKLFPVSPGKSSVYGIRCRPSLDKVPGRCDAAFLLVGRAQAAAALDECVRAGIRAAVMVDTVEPSSPLPAGLARAAREAGVALLGPSSLGCIDVPAGLYLFAARIPVAPLRPGRVSVVSESGGLLHELLRTAWEERRWGLRRAIAVGQQASISTGAALEYLARDAMTGCAVLILEGAGRREELRSAVESFAATGKGIVLFCASAAGGTAAAAGAQDATSARAFEARFLEALAERGGMFTAASVEEAAEAAGAMAPGGIERAGEPLHERWGRVKGRKVAIVGVSGGVGAWVKARAEEAGLEVPSFPRRLRERIAQRCPGVLDAGNPVDLSGRPLTDTGSFGEVLAALRDESGCDAVVAPVHFPSGASPSDRRNEAWIEHAGRLDGEGGRGAAAPPLVVVQATAAGPAAVDGAWVESCPLKGLGCALRLLAWAARRPRGAAAGAAGGQERPDGTDLDAARAIVAGPARTLSEPSSRKLLAAYGVAFPPWITAGSQSGAAAFARKLGRPVTMKMAGPQVAFDDGGAAQAGVKGDAAMRRAWVELHVRAGAAERDPRFAGVLVEETVGTGRGVELAAVSRCDGGAPLVFAPGAGAILCPATGEEASRLAQRAAAAAGVKVEPVGLARTLRRISFLAADLRDELKLVRCRFEADRDGATLCTGAQAVVAGDEE